MSEITTFPFFVTNPDNDFCPVEFHRSLGSTEPPLDKPALALYVTTPESRLSWQVTITKIAEPHQLRFYYICEYADKEPILRVRVVESWMGQPPPPLPPPPEGFEDAVIELQPGFCVVLILTPDMARRSDYRTFIVGDEWDGRMSLYGIQETPREPPDGPIEA